MLNVDDHTLDLVKVKPFYGIRTRTPQMGGVWKCFVKNNRPSGTLWKHYENIRVSRHCSPLSRCFKLVGQNHISSILTKLFCGLCKNTPNFSNVLFPISNQISKQNISIPSLSLFLDISMFVWTGEMDDIAIRPPLKKTSQTFSPGVDHPCIPLNEWMSSLHINHISWDDISEMFGGRWRII